MGQVRGGGGPQRRLDVAGGERIETLGGAGVVGRCQVSEAWIPVVLKRVGGHRATRADAPRDV